MRALCGAIITAGALIGLGLIVGDVIDAIGSKLAAGAASAVMVMLAILSFSQSGHWLNNLTFVRHTIDVNPKVAFAQNDLGGITELLRQLRREFESAEPSTQDNNAHAPTLSRVHTDCTAGWSPLSRPIAGGGI